MNRNGALLESNKVLKQGAGYFHVLHVRGMIQRNRVIYTGRGGCGT